MIEAPRQQSPEEITPTVPPEELNAYELFDDYLDAEIDGDKGFMEDYGEILAEKLDDESVTPYKIADLWADAESDSEIKGGVDVSATTNLLRSAIDKRVAAYAEENGKEDAEEFRQDIEHEKDDYLAVLRARHADGETAAHEEPTNMLTPTEDEPAQQQSMSDDEKYEQSLMNAIRKVRALEAEAAKNDPPAPEIDDEKLDALLDRLFPKTAANYKAEQDEPPAETKKKQSFVGKAKHVGQTLLRNVGVLSNETREGAEPASVEPAEEENVATGTVENVEPEEEAGTPVAHADSDKNRNESESSDDEEPNNEIDDRKAELLSKIPDTERERILFAKQNFAGAIEAGELEPGKTPLLAAFLQKELASLAARVPEGSKYADTVAAVVGNGGETRNYLHAVYAISSSRQGNEVPLGDEFNALPFSEVAKVVGLDVRKIVPDYDSRFRVR